MVENHLQHLPKQKQKNKKHLILHFPQNKKLNNKISSNKNKTPHKTFVFISKVP